ncbi:hypothetical protein K502DRAFT_363421 [Neoconidiobolus thromboides FSU 785]|nr:hypothetical protein K502DRAFT_363421 [Neoconidiobolus thromboides FSU 785]
MASNATLTTHLSMWPIPTIYFTLFLVCWSISKLGSKILGLPEPMRKFVTLASITPSENKACDTIEDRKNNNSIVHTKPPPIVKSKPQSIPLYQRFVSFIRPVFSSIYNFFNPPLVAIFAALLVGSIPQLKGLLYGPSPIFGAVAKALEACGGAAIPIVLIRLGSNIFMLLQGSKSVNIRVVGLIITIRFLLGPLVVIGLLVLAKP